MNSKRKGSGGEREFAELCCEYGYDVHRNNQMYIGGKGNPDIGGIDGLHIEVKRTEKLNIHAAMKQAIQDSEDKAVPIVAHRRNRDIWLVTMRAVDWFKMCCER